MRRNRGVPGSASQIFAVFVGNVDTLDVFVALGQAKVNDVDAVASRVCPANQKVVWLDVAMDDSLLVDLLDSLDELHCDHEDRLQVEVALALRMQVFKRGAQQIHHHDVKLLVGHRRVSADVLEPGHACFVFHSMDQLALPEEHNVFLVRFRLLNFCGVEALCTFLFNFVDLSESVSSAGELLDNLEAALEYFLSF